MNKSSPSQSTAIPRDKLTELPYITNLTKLSVQQSTHMSTTTVGEFAQELRRSPEDLLEQLRRAGVADKWSASDDLFGTDKEKLLCYLQVSHRSGSVERKKIIQVKKSTTQIGQLNDTHKARSNEVQVRGKQVMLKRDESEETAGADAAQDEAPQPGRKPARNRIIIVGNIGRDEATESWQRRYEAALASMGEWLCGIRTTYSFREATRDLKAVFEALRAKLRLTLKPSWEHAPAAAIKTAQLVTAGQHSFFHAGKVDGRNAP